MRRLVDLDQRSVSLARVLQELKSNPGLFSRQYYISLFKNATFPKEYAERDYDRQVGLSAELPGLKKYVRDGVQVCVTEPRGTLGTRGVEFRISKNTECQFKRPFVIPVFPVVQFFP